MKKTLKIAFAILLAALLLLSMACKDEPGGTIPTISLEDFLKSDFANVTIKTTKTDYSTSSYLLKVEETKSYFESNYGGSISYVQKDYYSKIDETTSYRFLYSDFDNAWFRSISDWSYSENFDNLLQSCSVNIIKVLTLTDFDIKTDGTAELKASAAGKVNTALGDGYYIFQSLKIKIEGEKVIEDILSEVENNGEIDSKIIKIEFFDFQKTKVNLPAEFSIMT